MIYAAFTHTLFAFVMISVGLIFLVLPRSYWGNYNGFIPTNLAESYRNRMQAALRKRLPPPAHRKVAGAINVGVGTILLFLQPDMPTGAAIFALVNATLYAVTDLASRKSGGARVASLEKRNPSAVVPLYLWVATGLAAATVLVFHTRSSVVVSVSMFSIVGLAWYLSNSPSIVTPDDPEVEQYVDQRLRILNAGRALMFATLPAFLLISRVSIREWWVLGIALIPWSAYMLTVFRMLFAARWRPSSATLAAWDAHPPLASN